jgi:hypothetical protein
MRTSRRGGRRIGCGLRTLGSDFIHFTSVLMKASRRDGAHGAGGYTQSICGVTMLVCNVSRIMIIK